MPRSISFGWTPAAAAEESGRTRQDAADPGDLGFGMQGIADIATTRALKTNGDHPIGIVQQRGSRRRDRMAEIHA